MSKIKILYIIDKMDRAGTQKHLLEVLRLINRDVFEPHLCCLVRIGELEEELNKIGIIPKVFGIKRIYGYSGIRDTLALAQYIKKEKFDIVHTYLFSANIAGNLAAKLAGAPVIISGRRDTGIHREGKWRHRQAYKFAHRLADKVFTVSNSVRDTVRKLEGVSLDKIVTIYNGIDVSCYDIAVDIARKKKELGINPEDRIVGIIANLSWVKGHKYFLEAAKLILEEIPNVRFLIIGDGPLKNNLKTLTNNLSLGENILFLGKRPDVPELLKIMDISVNASYSEGMSNTILESMAAGIPVIATDVDGNKEIIINNTTGLLTPAGDIQSMKEKIIFLLRQPEIADKIKQNAQKTIKEKFNLSRMIYQMESEYINLLKEKYDGRYSD
ncbi:MAG: glycosyltransferase [Candidatus Omnitrophota bacterium]|nr:glycosyltransferase [Candidatus Omnitrophota bacterium]